MSAQYTCVGTTTTAGKTQAEDLYDSDENVIGTQYILTNVVSAFYNVGLTDTGINIVVTGAYATKPDNRYTKPSKITQTNMTFPARNIPYWYI